MLEPECTNGMNPAKHSPEGLLFMMSVSPGAFANGLVSKVSPAKFSSCPSKSCHESETALLHCLYMIRLLFQTSSAVNFGGVGVIGISWTDLFRFYEPS